MTIRRYGMIMYFIISNDVDSLLSTEVLWKLLATEVLMISLVLVLNVLLKQAMYVFIGH